jgi:hypothetical protein
VRWVFDEFELDDETFELRRDGKMIPLQLDLCMQLTPGLVSAPDSIVLVLGRSRAQGPWSDLELARSLNRALIAAVNRLSIATKERNALVAILDAATDAAYAAWDRRGHRSPSIGLVLLDS